MAYLPRQVNCKIPNLRPLVERSEGPWRGSKTPNRIETAQSSVKREEAQVL